MDVIRTENYKLTQAIARFLFHRVKKSRPDTIDTNFTSWRWGPITITVSSDDHCNTSLVAYTDGDFFYVSYYPSVKYGLLVIEINKHRKEKTNDQ